MIQEGKVGSMFESTSHSLSWNVNVGVSVEDLNSLFNHFQILELISKTITADMRSALRNKPRSIHWVNRGAALKASSWSIKFVLFTVLVDIDISYNKTTVLNSCLIFATYSLFKISGPRKFSHINSLCQSATAGLWYATRDSRDPLWWRSQYDKVGRKFRSSEWKESYETRRRRGL